MLEEHKDNLDYIKSKIINIEDIFQENEKIILDDKKLELFLNGVKLKFDTKERNI